MRLRPRLAMATAAVAVPMVLGLVWFDGVQRRHTGEVLLAEVARLHVTRPEQRAACEADPAHWGGTLPPPDHPRPSSFNARPRGGPPTVHAYDAAFHAQNPDAPPVPAALIAAIADQDVATTTSWHPWDPAIVVLVRTPWTTGPCRHVLVHATTQPGFVGAILPATQFWLLPLVVVIAAVLLVVGPVVRRIRRLTDTVECSAASGYESGVTVDGSDELADLARAFERAGAEVRGREQALRRFLADTSHDVMVPLTVLQGHLAELRTHAERGGQTDAATVIAAMDEAHYIASILHNLAVAAKLDADAPRLHPARVDLSALVERVLGRHRPIARQLQVSLEGATPDDPITLDADVTLLEQAVSNLVYNAIRHNHSGGHVAVTLEPGEPAGFVLRVADDGPGMTTDELARITERGFRGDAARTRVPEGKGLGLAIARRVADLHGLSLTFTSPAAGGLQVELSSVA